MKLQGKYLSIGREERIVLGLLTQYGPLKVSQIGKYLRYKNGDTTNRLVERMIHRQLVYRCGAALTDCEAIDEITANPKEQLSLSDNDKKQRAFWVIVDFLLHDRITGASHSGANYPAQAMLISNQKSIYEIIVIDEGDEIIDSYQTTNHHRQHIEAFEDNADAINYIVVIRSPNQIPDIKIPNLYAFAVVNNETGDVKYIAAGQRRRTS